MKLKGTETRRDIKVEVSMLSVVEELQAEYLVKIGLEKYAYINRTLEGVNIWQVDHECWTSHSSLETNILREATEEEVLIYNGLKALRKFLYK